MVVELSFAFLGISLRVVPNHKNFEHFHLLNIILTTQLCGVVKFGFHGMLLKYMINLSF